MAEDLLLRVMWGRQLHEQQANLDVEQLRHALELSESLHHHVPDSVAHLTVGQQQLLQRCGSLPVLQVESELDAVLHDELQLLLPVEARELRPLPRARLLQETPGRRHELVLQLLCTEAEGELWVRGDEGRELRGVAEPQLQLLEPLIHVHRCLSLHHQRQNNLNSRTRRLLLCCRDLVFELRHVQGIVHRFPRDEQGDGTRAEHGMLVQPSLLHEPVSSRPCSRLLLALCGRQILEAPRAEERHALP
eukprot:763766-Hanusia_phi.AAC.3